MLQKNINTLKGLVNGEADIVVWLEVKNIGFDVVTNNYNQT